jgi:ribA/ribD-fused uncharacterized protein
MNKIYKFGGREHPFSNYYPASAAFEGITFSSGEGAFQAAKTLDIKLRETFVSIDPGKAKSKGRRLSLRPDWEEVKYDIMLDVLRSKFKDKVLRYFLLDTGGQHIIEDTTGWHDNVWGDCSCQKCKDVKGQNLLGKALMALRAELTVITIPPNITVIDWDYIKTLSSKTVHLHLHADVKAVSINEIGGSLFHLQCITVDEESKHFFSSADILYSKDKTQLLCFPCKKDGDVFAIPDHVTHVGAHAFMNCDKLTEITLPDGLQRIGSQAFWNCWKLKRIHFPAEVVEIGETALFGCSSLEEISVDKANPNYCSDDDVLYDKTQTQLIVVAAAKKREFFIVPETVRSFGVAAFRECTHLKRIHLPDGITELSRGLFDDCWHLEDIDLPFSLERINPVAFSHCHALKRIRIPFGVRSIGWNAFHWCEGLEEIHLPQYLKELGVDDLKHTFEHGATIVMCDNLKRINIPPRITELGASELSMHHALEEVFIPPTVTKIGERAFSVCPALTLTVYEGTAGHDYAVENKIPFRLASKIIAAHAGTGKTTLAANQPDAFTDLVAMPYKYLLPDTPMEEHEANKANPELEYHPEWPLNYFEAIKEAMKTGKTLLIPPAYPVLSELYRAGIPYTLAYPHPELKEEYRARYEARGNNETFMFYFVDGWDDFQESFKEDNYGTHLVLEAGEYLSDRLMP